MLALVCVFALTPAADPKPTPNPRQVAEGYVAAALAGQFDDAVKLAEEGKSPAKPESAKKLKELIAAKSLGLPTVLISDKHGYAMAVSDPIGLPEKAPAGADRRCLIFTLKKTKDGKWVLKDIDLSTVDKAETLVKELKTRDPDAKPIPATKS
ncbi:hypothetical protein R5W23_002293 [Gemmata sp. JC673]|uniref:DUF3828 domain-containing protein n=1 Tax=Gemmata algarum TaxID=2975278 RepID=A0ABU5F1H3_9BACT|nr:hypothetical protein [Gemmata algarum]MDY3561034.1 hypothetical protein [Gemmata algarum]